MNHSKLNIIITLIILQSQPILQAHEPKTVMSILPSISIDSNSNSSTRYNGLGISIGHVASSIKTDFATNEIIFNAHASKYTNPSQSTKFNFGLSEQINIHINSTQPVYFLYGLTAEFSKLQSRTQTAQNSFSFGGFGGIGWSFSNANKSSLELSLGMFATSGSGKSTCASLAGIQRF